LAVELEPGYILCAKPQRLDHLLFLLLAKYWRQIVGLLPRLLVVQLALVPERFLPFRRDNDVE
jgi:hypothetical protein